MYFWNPKHGPNCSLILTEPSFQSLHMDRNTMIFYENTDDNQNPLLKQWSIANFSSAKVSTSLVCNHSLFLRNKESALY